MISLDRVFWVQVLMILAIHLFGRASSQSTTADWINIDCGSDDSRIDSNTLLTWDTDKDFTRTGTNKFVSEKQQYDEMNTLRFFPKGKQNCYVLKVIKKTVRYMIRVGFCYGNYDGLSSPPTFDLHIDGKKWSTVKTSTVGDPIYREVIYESRGSGRISLCLVRVKDGGVPFISSIEAVPLDQAAFPLYPKMERNHIFNLESRLNFGGDEVRYTPIITDEKYNRIWRRGETPPDCDLVSTSSDSSVENEPPDAVTSDSIEAENIFDPISLSVDLSQTTTPQSAYIVLYFTEQPFTGRDVRSIQIYTDGHFKSTVTLENPECKVVTIYPMIAVGSSINVTLTSDDVSSLPPIISAMEVFTRVDKSSAPLLQCRSFFCAFVNLIISCTCLLLFLA